MPTKRRAKKKVAPKKRPLRKAPPKKKSDVPTLFRINIEVGDIDRGAAFYQQLLGVSGRKDRGSRCYFDCGAVTLQVVQLDRPHTAAKALYFTVQDLDAAFARAQGLGCLSNEEVHGERGGEIAVRPWGERSFYVEDPWQNPLCFVEAGTVYAG
jgi:predicted enzyme related to lactoylglutathione lyase